ncbi:MAG: hypoxanthine phosphoribosyltransferase [Desulfovibrionaceae bacterium]|nr:hypoxanthine phosphoribosyltransferase [Desulfovibrionaceae bacterium]
MGEVLREVIGEEAVAGRVAELAGEISRCYDDGDPPIVICVLKGAVYFFTDLTRHFPFSPQIEFVRIASYGAGTSPGQDLRFLVDVDCPLEGRHVLVVEDIVDTGRTSARLLEIFAARNPKTLRLCALIDKPLRREVDVPVDFVGFTSRDGYLIGYGMDYAERYRQLPGVWEMQIV